MKKISISLVCASLVMFAGIVFITTGNAIEETTYKFMEHGPGGGWIFYDKGSYSDGWRYLEVAVDNENYGRVKWGCSGKSISGANGTAIGTGKANTLAIIKNCKDENTAAKKAAEYRGGGKTDWFLPSKDELQELIDVLGGDDVIGGGPNTYWSSTEVGPSEAWLDTYYGDDRQEKGEKDTALNIIPVRAF